MKKLKNVEDINKKQLEKQLKPIKNGTESVNKNSFKKLRFLNKLGTITKETLDEVNEIDKQFNYTKLVSVHTNGKVFEFGILRRQGNLIRSI